MEQHLSLLGYRVRDLLTGFEGVATSISFDISGCVQALVSPGVDNEGKVRDRHWFDTKRLAVISDESFVPAPHFTHVPGGQKLPGFRSKPTL